MYTSLTPIHEIKRTNPSTSKPPKPSSCHLFIVLPLNTQTLQPWILNHDFVVWQGDCCGRQGEVVAVLDTFAGMRFDARLSWCFVYSALQRVPNA